MKLAVSLLRVSSDRQYQEGQGINVQKKTIGFIVYYEKYSANIHARNTLPFLLKRTSPSAPLPS